MRTVANNAKGLAYLNRRIREMGIQVAPSSANFVMLVFADEGEAQGIFEGLLRRGVIVRPLTATGLPNCLRVSVGTPEENQFFIEALDRVRQEMETHSYATVD